MVGRTTVIVAHRLKTLRQAQKIALIRQGTVAELGTHEELMAKSEAYKHLVHLQQVGM
jgi:ATP-binding cassette subfamily B (MDR/TAP) protein 1